MQTKIPQYRQNIGRMERFLLLKSLILVCACALRCSNAACVCNETTTALPTTTAPSTTTSSQTPSLPYPLLVGAFNAKTLGESKMSDPFLADIIAQVDYSSVRCQKKKKKKKKKKKIADDSLLFIYFFFSETIRLDIHVNVGRRLAQNVKPLFCKL